MVDYTATPDSLPADLTYSSDATVGGSITCNNLTVDAGVTLTLDSQAVIYTVYGDAVINGTIEATGLGVEGGKGQYGLSGSFVIVGRPGLGYGAAHPEQGSAPAYPPGASFLGSGGGSVRYLFWQR